MRAREWITVGLTITRPLFSSRLTWVRELALPISACGERLWSTRCCTEMGRQAMLFGSRPPSPSVCHPRRFHHAVIPPLFPFIHLPHLPSSIMRSTFAPGHKLPHRC